MKKKILFGFGALAVALVALPMFAAFEAHVINVTAKIENALSVDTDPINFGTVFPQEYLVKPLTVELSESFIDENNADDVNYIIRQKPKCAITEDDGKTLVGSTTTGHVIPGQSGSLQPGQSSSDGQYHQFDGYYVDCGEAPTLSSGQSWGLLPMLCPYLSKHPDGVDDQNKTNTTGATNDDSTPAFHYPFTVNGNDVDWNDTKGRLAKSENDTVDDWKIDLAVPCFGDHCAQDWADFVKKHNPDEEQNASSWALDKNLEHKIFGCDLWIEVTGVSRN